MGGIINEFFKSLKPKEKIVVISSIAALGAVLIGVVLLIAFCGTEEHIHNYDYKLELVDGKFNVVGECKAEDCDKPEVLFANVNAEVESSKTATCSEKGETVYVYTHEGVTLKYTEQLDVTGHMYNGKTFEAFVGEDGFVNYDETGVKLFEGVEYTCSKKSKGGLNCDFCGQLASVDVYTPHIAEEKKLDMADCVNAAKVQSVCKFCETVLSEPTDSGSPLGHEYNYSLSGTKLSANCQRCDYSYNASVTIVSESKKPATCAAPAVITYTVKTASGENITFSQNGPDSEKPAHILNGRPDDGSFSYDTPGVQFSSFIPCGESGNGYYVCDTCGATNIVEGIKVPDHAAYADYTTLQAPTYETGGMITIKCSRDGCEWGIPAMLSKVKEGVNTIEIVSLPTDTEPGIAKYKQNFKVKDTDINVDIILDRVEYAPPLGHDYTYSINGTQLTIGCSRCDYTNNVNVTIELKITKPATCSSLAKTMYVVKTPDGETHDFIIESGAVNPSAHVLNGVIDNGSFGYNTPGVQFSTFIPCGKTGSGYYVCEECHEQQTVNNITAPDHDVYLDYSSAQLPSYNSKGIISLKCHRDGCTWSSGILLPLVKEGENTTEIISAPTVDAPGIAKYKYETKITDDAGHEHICTVVFDRVEYAAAASHNFGNYKRTQGSSANLWNITAECLDDGCDAVIDERDVIMDSETIHAANCAHGTITDYVFKTKDNKYIEFSIESGSKDNSVHILNGNAHSVYENPDGTFNYVEGIKFFGSDSISCGGKVANGYFNCELCEEPIKINNIIKPHDYKVENVTDPTTSAVGTIILTCKSAGCESVRETYDLPVIDTEGADKNAEIIESDGTSTTYKYTYYIPNTGYTVERTITVLNTAP